MNLWPYRSAERWCRLEKKSKQCRTKDHIVVHYIRKWNVHNSMQKKLSCTQKSAVNCLILAIFPCFSMHSSRLVMQIMSFYVYSFFEFKWFSNIFLLLSSNAVVKRWTSNKKTLDIRSFCANYFRKMLKIFLILTWGKFSLSEQWLEPLKKH